jgi:phage/plasmid-like protein (TIGR03299 family)
MVFVGQTPWHGLGTSIETGLSPAEVMARAGLDWKVVQLPLLVQGKKEVRPVKDHVALVRSSDGKLLDVVSTAYKPLQNSALFEFMAKYTDAGEMTMHTAGSLDGGRIVWALAKMDGEFTIPGSQDKTEMHLLFSSGHKLGFAVQIDLTTIRVVCQNTLMMARGYRGKGGDGEKYGRYRMIHTATWDDNRKAEAREVVELGRRVLEDYRVKANRLVKTLFDPATTEAFVIELLQPKLFEKVVEASQGASTLRAVTPGQPVDGTRVLDMILSRDEYRFNAEDFSPTTERVLDSIRRQPGAAMFPETAWNAYNGVTYFVDHLRGESRDTGLQAAWYGPGAQLKNAALDLAVDYVDRLDTISRAAA